MKSLLDSLKLQLNDRLSSPLFGAFLISWLVWNHQYLLIIFSEGPIVERLRTAEAIVYPDYTQLVLRGVVSPTITSVVFILIYPFPARWLFGYWHRRQAETKKLRDQIENETPLTIEESRKIRIALLNSETEYRDKIRVQADLIESLRTELAQLNKVPPSVSTLSALESVTKAQEPKFPEGVSTLIGLLAAKPSGDAPMSVITSALKEPSMKVLYYVDEAKKAKLVEVEHTRKYNEITVSLTPNGRKFAVNAKFI